MKINNEKEYQEAVEQIHALQKIVPRYSLDFNYYDLIYILQRSVEDYEYINTHVIKYNGMHLTSVDIEHMNRLKEYIKENKRNEFKRNSI